MHGRKAGDEPGSARIRLVERPRGSPRYQPVEFTIQIPSPEAVNPFRDIQCEATFTSPSGETCRVEGFSDSGDGSVIKLRFCPREEGVYRYRLRCGDLAASAVFVGELRSQPSALQGFVRIDPDHPRHFRYDAGGHPFLAGKTAWLLSSSPHWRRFLDLCAQQRQNVVRFALGGIDFGAGRLSCHWWGGNGAAPDLGRFNLPQWQQIDEAVRYAGERGILVEVCLFADTTHTHPGGFPIPDPAMERFWDYTLARLASYPNVLLWQLFNECSGHGEYQAYMAAYLRRHDPYGHIVTTSGREVGDMPFPTAAWNDVVVPHFCTGSHLDLHDFYRSWALKLCEYAKPVYVDETGRATEGQGNYDGEHRRKQYWIWAVSGVYCNFHSKGGCYVDLTREPGEEYWPHLVNFWETTRWYQMQPSGDLVRSYPQAVIAAYALASEDEAVVYLYSDGDETVTAGELGLDLAGGRWWVHWYDPKTGSSVAAERLAWTGGPVALDTPTFRADLALQLLRMER